MCDFYYTTYLRLTISALYSLIEGVVVKSGENERKVLLMQKKVIIMGVLTALIISGGVGCGNVENVDTVPASVLDFLASTGIETSYVIAGTAVVSDTVKNRVFLRLNEFQLEQYHRDPLLCNLSKIS